MKVLQQALFANTRFADDQRDLPFTIQRALPAIDQQAQFFLAADEWGKATRCCRCFEPSTHSTGLDYPINLDRPVGAFECLRAAIFNHE